MDDILNAAVRAALEGICANVVLPVWMLLGTLKNRWGRC